MGRINISKEKGLEFDFEGGEVIGLFFILLAIGAFFQPIIVELVKH